MINYMMKFEIEFYYDFICRDAVTLTSDFIP